MAVHHMRKFLSRLWVWIFVAVIAVTAHLYWAIRTGKAEWLQRSGASVIICGIFIVARPLIRSGVDRIANQQLPRYPGTFAMATDSWKKHDDAIAKIRPEIVRDVQAERFFGVVVIVIGTVLNGYGDLLLRWFGY